MFRNQSNFEKKLANLTTFVKKKWYLKLALTEETEIPETFEHL